MAEKKNTLVNAIVVGVVIALVLWLINALFGRPLKAENGTIILTGFVSGIVGYYLFSVVGGDKWFCERS